MTRVLKSIVLLVCVFVLPSCTTTSVGQGEWTVFFGTQVGARQQGATSEADSTNSIEFDESVLDRVLGGPNDDDDGGSDTESDSDSD